MRMQESIEVEAPAADVWAVVGDYGHDARWRGEIVGVTSEPAGPVTVGARVVETARFMGMTLATHGEVFEVAGRSFRWRTGGGLSFRGHRRVEENGSGGSQVTLTMEGQFTGLLLPLRILEPFIQFTMRRQVAANLVRLRAHFSAR